MRIMHIGLACHFTEDMTYQDNQLSFQNVLDGHEVLFVSDTKKYKDGKLIEVGYEDTILTNGVRLIRLPYRKFICKYISGKIRQVNNLYSIARNFSPDVILSHDLSYFSVMDIIRYKKNHPEVKLYADTHTARYNSARNWLSLRVLHGLFYKYLIQKSLPYLEKYFYVGEAEKEFNINVYGVPESILEFYPLGGFLFSDEQYRQIREEKRAELGVRSDDKLYIHSGKLEKLKRTKDLVEAFSSVKDLKAKLAIIGTVPEDQKKILMPLLKADKRIFFLGWKTGGELREYLCAGDIYCQPGNVSATLQNAICQDCVIISYPHLEYVQHLDYGNVFWIKSKEDMIKCFERISENPQIIEKMKSGSKRCAKELLDYKKLAARLYR